MSILKKRELYEIVNQSKILIWRANIQGLCDYFNEEWLSFTGRTLEQELGNGWAEGVHPEDFDRCLKIYLDNFKERRSFEMEYRLKRHDGVYRWILDRGEPYFDANKKFVGYIGSCFDIHDRILMQDELIKAKEKAEESNHLKSAFLANMSHEIRTPMNAIIGFTNLLKENHFSDEEKKNFLEYIELGGNRLLSLISDIVDISKIDSNQLSLYYQICNLNKLLEELQKQFEISNINTNCKMSIYKGLNDKESVIFIDETRLSQILSNLIENALKFTKNGNVEFGYTYLKEKNLLQFFVKDNGIGIDAKDFDFIFERFTQVDSSYSKSVSGTGLGLAIVKNLIHLLKGEIWLESKKGEGSTFYFTIPYQSKKVKKIMTNNHSDLTIDNKITILIAEDEYLNFKYLEMILSKYQYNLIHVINGQEAVDVIKKNDAIDLILMDIKMPIMDGYEATIEIRKINKEIPIIALTAYAMDADKQKALTIGCNDYLTKPISKQVLSDAIDRII